MAKIRVLIVDDSVVIRKLLSDTLASDSDIEVVGTAADGRIALQRLTQLQPDLITLDVEMPGLSGIDTVREVRKTHPKLPIIMFSTVTDHGSISTIEALSAGASDYVAKPSNVGSVTAGKEKIKLELSAKIKALCHRKTVFTRGPQLGVAASLPNGRCKGRYSVLAFGTSTGGPNALAEIIPALPLGLPIPILITQHMPPLFTKTLATRLAQLSKLSVQEAQNGAILEAGKVYVAPGDFHMEVRRDGNRTLIHNHQGPQENSCRPAVDVTFRSLVDAYGGEVLAVVLTGMGQDGKLGARKIREAGGTILAQDEASSVVWGMPGAVVADGLADEVLDLKAIPARIASYLNCTTLNTHSYSSVRVDGR